MLVIKFTLACGFLSTLATPAYTTRVLYRYSPLNEVSRADEQPAKETNKVPNEKERPTSGSSFGSYGVVALPNFQLVLGGGGGFGGGSGGLGGGLVYGGGSHHASNVHGHEVYPVQEIHEPTHAYGGGSGVHQGGIIATGGLHGGGVISSLGSGTHGQPVHHVEEVNGVHGSGIIASGGIHGGGIISSGGILGGLGSSSVHGQPVHNVGGATGGYGIGSTHGGGSVIHGQPVHHVESGHVQPSHTTGGIFGGGVGALGNLFGGFRPFASHQRPVNNVAVGNDVYLEGASHQPTHHSRYGYAEPQLSYAPPLFTGHHGPNEIVFVTAIPTFPTHYGLGGIPQHEFVHRPWYFSPLPVAHPPVHHHGHGVSGGKQPEKEQPTAALPQKVEESPVPATDLGNKEVSADTTDHKETLEAVQGREDPENMGENLVDVGAKDFVEEADAATASGKADVSEKTVKRSTRSTNNVEPSDLSKNYRGCSNCGPVFQRLLPLTDEVGARAAREGGERKSAPFTAAAKDVVSGGKRVDVDLSVSEDSSALAMNDEDASNLAIKPQYI